MRLTENNIEFVREFIQDGITFHWFVSLNSHRVSDSRSYVNYKNGISVVDWYPMQSLPKSVQKFIQKHEKVFEKDVYGVKHYIYK